MLFLIYSTNSFRFANPPRPIGVLWSMGVLGGSRKLCGAKGALRTIQGASKTRKKKNL